MVSREDKSRKALIKHNIYRSLLTSFFITGHVLRLIEARILSTNVDAVLFPNKAISIGDDIHIYLSSLLVYELYGPLVFLSI